MLNTEKTLETIVTLCKGRGFVYPGSEIYGGLANTWDYGPLGVELKTNIKAAWRKKFIQENKYNVGLDSAILMNPQTWIASGHLGGFSDPLMDCCECKTRHRADDLIENFDGTNVAGWSNEEMSAYIKEHNIPCPNCGKTNFTDIRQFNLMFKTFQGVTEDTKDEIYLRPETAQGIFVNFANIQRTSRKKIPFGVAQIGKSFRNEITPGKFIFRVRERTLSGLLTGEASAATGFIRSESKRKTSACATMTPRSFPSIQRLQRTLNTCSPSAGASSGVLPTERITTLPSTLTFQVKTLNTLTRLRARNTFLT